MGETDDSKKLFSEMFPQNSERVEAQKKAPIKVIIGNPPYSIGQKSANDNAQNQSYPKLDARIAETYAKESKGGLNKSLYDSYIKAFRWSTDRLDSKSGGIIAFITNGNWIDKPSMDGFRKYLQRDFNEIYVINLRGSIRGKSPESAKKEGQNIFNILTGVAITILVKNPNKRNSTNISYYDIGDYLTRNEKLEILTNNKSINSTHFKFSQIKPDKHYDWINLRNSLFESYFEIVPLKKYDHHTKSIFTLNVIGVVTNRDSWVYNFSKSNLTEIVSKTIDEFNSLRDKYFYKPKSINLNKFIEENSEFTKWTVNLKKDFERNNEILLNTKNIFICNYRPFVQELLYYEKHLIERPGIFNSIFPDGGIKYKNLAIGISGEIRKEFSLLMIDKISDLEVVGRAQYLPLYYYKKRKKQQTSLFDEVGESEYIRRDGVSNFILEQGKKIYGKNVSKEDIFYYVYGFLHSQNYRETFANDLKKMLPRIPLVDSPRDFWKFSKAGRALADLHINYEKVPPYDGVIVHGAEKLSFIDNEPAYTTLFKVQKMRFPKKDRKDTIIYNSKITIENIPEKAYEYVVNGKSAIEWIMERYQVKTDKKSGIKNDPNDWADEVGNPRYILDLLLSIINVSVQTVDIVNNLPELKFE